MQTCNSTTSTKTILDEDKNQQHKTGVYNTPNFIIPLAIIQDPSRLFMAIKFNFASSNDIPIENVKFKGTFCAHFLSTKQDGEVNSNARSEQRFASYQKIFRTIGEDATEYVIAFSDLLVQGVNWDYER